MKLSKVLHVGSVVVGVAGVVSFAAAVFWDSESVFGVTKIDALVCTAVLMLIAIWAAVGTIHHMMLEEKGELI